MTLDEVQICFEKHYPVVCVKAKDNSGFIVGREYHIASINHYRHYKYKNEGQHCSIALEQNKRSTVTVFADAIEPAEQWKSHIEEMLRQRKNEAFKNLIAELKTAGLEKSAVLQRVNKFYDECKTQ